MDPDPASNASLEGIQSQERTRIENWVGLNHIKQEPFTHRNASQQEQALSSVNESHLPRSDCQGQVELTGFCTEAKRLKNGLQKLGRVHLCFASTHDYARFSGHLT